MRAAGSEADNIGYVPIVDVRVAALGLRLARGRAIAAVAQFKAAVGAVCRPDGRVRVEDGVEACVVAARVVRGVDRLRDCQCDEVSAKWACLLGLRPACLNQR